MKVCFFRYSLRNRGGDRAVVTYANHLAASGYEVTFCLNVLDTIFALEPSIRIDYIKLPTPIGTILSGAVRKLSYDIVFVDIIHLAVPLALRNRVVYLAQAYDSLYYEHPIQQAAVDLLYKAYFSRRDAFGISISDMLTDMLREKFGDCAAFDDKLKTVVLGIDHSKFYPEPDSGLIEEKQGRVAIFVLCRGDSFRKGFDITTAVLNETIDELKDKAEVWVCGDAVQFKPKTRYLGRPGDDELRRILSSADIFLYPSRHEGFGLFPLEAMACGLPVLTTHTVPYVKDGDNAFVAHPEIEEVKKALLTAVSNHGIRMSVRQKGFITARAYDISESKRKFEAIVRNLRP